MFNIKKYLPEIGIILLVLALLIALSVQSNRLQRSQNSYAQLENTFAAYKLAQQSKIQKLEQQMINTLEEVKNEAQEELEKLQANAADANGVAYRLRQQLSDLRAAQNTAPADDCQAARAYIGVLTELLGESDHRAGAYAEQADRSRNAGLACERIYGGLVQKDKN